MPTDFRNDQGTGVVVADGFKTGAGVSAPKVVVNSAITFDPPSLAAAADAYSTGIAVTGAALGDAVELYPPYDTQGVTAFGNVSAANTIKISLHNGSAGIVDLASGSWGVVVKRRL